MLLFAMNGGGGGVGVGVGIGGGSGGVRYVAGCGEYQIHHQPTQTLARIKTLVYN